MRSDIRVLMLALFAVAPRLAEAYLDPSTGSMIISAIVGLFASIALAVKTYWYRIKSLFRRDGSPAETESKEPGA